MPAEQPIEDLVSRFLTWPLPQSVCADLCATDRTYAHPRSGTNLLTADEAGQMVRHILAGELDYRAWCKRDPAHEAEGTLESIETTAAMLEIYGPECFPANEAGQVDFGRMMMDSAAAEIRAFLSKSSPVGEAARIAEVMAEGDGHWSPCSGCRESVDGCVSTTDYPYDPKYKCQPGGGCGECGGIGVTWTPAGFYDGMAEFHQQELRTEKAILAALGKLAVINGEIVGQQTAVEAILALSPILSAEGESRLLRAAIEVLQRKSGTYKARNGREVGIEAEDGEKCWIVHSDDIEALQRAVSELTPPAENGR